MRQTSDKNKQIKNSVATSGYYPRQKYIRFGCSISFTWSEIGSYGRPVVLRMNSRWEKMRVFTSGVTDPHGHTLHDTRPTRRLLLITPPPSSLAQKLCPTRLFTQRTFSFIHCLLFGGMRSLQSLLFKLAAFMNCKLSGKASGLPVGNPGCKK